MYVFAGREMLRRLVQEDIACSYVLINSAAYVMKEVLCVRWYFCLDMENMFSEIMCCKT